ncbi:response regulator [Candidatus Deferrimicrobium sp.]|uniref:response regulator n=1 Tax=Candidatus Deferrimicrobium sp. TaxID=3060586 RepID=UPI002ED50D9E
MSGNGSDMNLYKDLGVESILLIGEDPWSRESLTTYFRIVKCDMQSAENAMEAVVAVSRSQFDLILCEYQLPGMSGITLMKLLEDIQPGTVKFLFTSYPIQKLTEEAVRSGIHEVIRIPFTMATFEESLKRYFPRTRHGGRESVGAH